MTRVPDLEPPQHFLSRKQSTRRLPHSMNLSSSELSPSEHSSLYDAVPLTFAPQHVDDAPGYDEDVSEGEQQTSKTISYSSGLEQAGNGKHVGTRLFTIVEQKSVPSLSTFPSGWESQRRVSSLEPQLSAEVAQARHSRTTRRRCYSADDGASGMHRKDFDSEPLSAESMSDSRHLEHFLPTLPVEPPFRPPERVQTPTGLPRWPGELNHESFTVRRLNVRASRRDLLMQYLRRPPSRPKLKEVLRGERAADLGRDVRTGTRFWRPPSSGHTTRRFEGLESHPFSLIPISSPYGTSLRPRDQPTSGSERFSYNVESSNELARSDRKIHDTAAEQPSTLSDARRALTCAGQNAVPVSPGRASALASKRLIAVPSHVHILTGVERDPDSTSQSHVLSTAVTTDMSEGCTFPTRQRQSRQHILNRCPWSLFPAPSRRGKEEERESPSRPHTVAGSEDSGASNLALRGESQSRYRHSGTPIYDPDGNSLRTVDRDRERSEEHDTSISATSALAARLDTQRQRAILNGASRFSFRLEPTTLGTPTSRTQHEDTENQRPIPILPPEPQLLCKHKLTKLRRGRRGRDEQVLRPGDATNLDGTSNPFFRPNVVTQNFDLAAPSMSIQERFLTAPVNRVDLSPPRTTTFATTPNGATTFTTSPSHTTARAESPFAMPGRA